MKSLSSLGSVFLVLTIAACGGGGDNSSGNDGNGREEPLPAVKLNSSPQVIEYHGDSTVWGYLSGTTGERVATPAPTAFGNALPAYHTVENLGLNQSTACDLLEGTGGYTQNWREYMAASNASVVIINHGINDMSAYDTTRYRSCLNQLVDIAQSENKVVILETPNPAVDAGENRRIVDYVETMRSVAQQQEVLLIDQYKELEEEFAANPTEICPDGVHPSQEVYVRKGQFAAAEFAEFDAPQ